METFSYKTKGFVSHISDKIRGIRRKNLKIEDICNFCRYNDMHTKTIRM